MAEIPDRLLADIGGTNARFALATRRAIAAIKIYPVRQYPQLTDALQVFLNEECGGAAPACAALAVAGPQLGDIIRPTNSDWVCDRAAIAEMLRLELGRVTILNDFAAVAWALNSLQPGDVTVLQSGRKSPSHPMLVMGPGTGLGMAALVPHGQGWAAIATEGGQTRYAPANSDERHLIDQIARRHIFVTNEQLVSGSGLVNIYRALGEEQNGRPMEPADVVDQARGGQARAREALNMFAAIFGSFASQAALSYIALGGVYLTGGVLQKIGADFAVDRFLQRFATNPQMAPLLHQMPVLRVNADIPAFAGLQYLLSQQS